MIAEVPTRLQTLESDFSELEKGESEWPPSELPDPKGQTFMRISINSLVTLPVVPAVVSDTMKNGTTECLLRVTF